MDTLISIIVPIYKVEPYLKTCVDSLLTQTYGNLEIILVDDGSPDGCGAICDAYALQDSRVRVIHKENGGLSDARNVGFAESKGQFVLFIDSDDCAAPTMAERLYTACRENGAELAVCYFDTIGDTQVPEEKPNLGAPSERISGPELIRRIYRGEGAQIAFTAWNKLYRRELFEKNGISYPKGRYHEDTFTTYKLLYYAEAAAVVPENLYHYRIRGGSIMTTAMAPDRCQDSLDAGAEAAAFFAEHGAEDLSSMAFYAYCRGALMQYAGLTGTANRPCRDLIRSHYRKTWTAQSGWVQLRGKQKLLCSAFHRMPGVTGGLVRLIRAGNR